MTDPPERTDNNSPSSASTPRPLGHRARIACKACNARRVKCDAAEGQPCWQCRIRQIPCELIESRRGKYTRKKRGPAPEVPISHPTQGSMDRSIAQDTSTPASTTSVGHTGSSQGSGRAESFGPVEQSEEQQASRPSQAPHQSQMQSNSRSYQPADSSNLSYIVEVVHRPKDGSTEPLRVHYPIPASIVEQPVPEHARKAVEPMSLEEALIMPEPEVADQLVYAFFEVIHSAYPVFDRSAFTRSYLLGQASPLVLQTIFLLGFTVGSDRLVEAGGFVDRATARRTHYLRAKTLYDADYDKDRMNAVAVLLLLGFWWVGREDQKDTCYWVTCATTVAQSMGLHRSISHSSLSPQMRSLRKRVWWAIYTRDHHTSAAFGRPCRIRDEDCDIEPLTEEDFLFDSEYDQRLIPIQQDFHIAYVLEMTKLAAILEDILVAEFSPRRAMLDKYETKMLKSDLLHWKARLPVHLQSSPLDGSLGAPFWASMLHFSYYYCHILLFRPKAIENLSPEEAERDTLARIAADAITRNAEDQLAAETIRSAQIHLVPALFGALSMHTIVICRKDPIRRQLAENKSRQCLLALSELSRSWPVKLWISKSFISLMKRLTGQDSAASAGTIVNVSSTIEHSVDSGAISNHGLPDTNEASASSSSRDDGQSAVDSSYTSNTEFQGTQSHDYAAQNGGTDQVFYDNFWSGYLDSAFDVDLLIHPNACLLHTVPSEAYDGGPNTNAPGGGT